MPLRRCRCIGKKWVFIVRHCHERNRIFHTAANAAGFGKLKALSGVEGQPKQTDDRMNRIYRMDSVLDRQVRCMRFNESSKARPIPPIRSILQTGREVSEPRSGERT
jgi:hypothetical protein